MLIHPTVGKVRVLHFRHIDKRVMVTVHRHITAAVVRQDTCMQRLVDVVVTEDLPTAHEVRFRHQFAIDHEVETQRILQLRTK